MDRKRNEVVLIVDESGEDRDKLRVYLEEKEYKVLEACDGTSAWEALCREKVDLVILEMDLPDQSGILLCKRIYEKYCVAIVFLAKRWEEEQIIEVLRSGADDYIQKPFHCDYVEAKIESVLRRTKQRDKGKVFLNDLVYDAEERKVLVRGKEVHLTPTEYKLFETFVSAPNRVFTREQLIHYALQGEFDGFDRSIDTYIKGLRQKIEADRSKPKHIITVYGVGYRFVP
ncbi:response regulator transcription factor [Anaerosporobacter faecicola]|uniref:response regulator transcription factor n=1 Tax=Anaerosporobacter faecicola TaxID=2718714 RepID=UPI00143A4AB3|nr:response regulator transcription factor [Anaerosporobacter faecicola]